jgi:hypothetical protein
LFLASGVAAVAATLLFVPAAAAALWLIFSKTTATPGDAVAVRTAGRGAFAQAQKEGALRRSPPLRLFLVRSAVVDSVRALDDRRLIALGTLAVDRRGNGSARFTVPNVRPGDYAVLLQCAPCARYSAGRVLIPVGPFPGPFRVLEAPPALRDCSSSQYGALPAGWEQTSAVRAGPIAFYFFESVASVQARSFSAIPGRRGYYRPFKVLAVVENDVGSVTVSIPSAYRSRLAFVYALDSSGRNLARWAMRVVDGQSAVTFNPCTGVEPAQTQFGGGFVVAGSQCAHLEIRVAGRPDPLPIALPFGRAC